MKSLTLILLVLVLFCGVIGLPSTTNAVSPSDIKELRITEHFFTTRIIGYEGKTRYILDPTKGRFLVLLVTATIPEGKTKLFTQDFRLQYYHNDGKEDRAPSLGISPVESNDPVIFLMTQDAAEPWMAIVGPQVQFALFFFVENDVSSVSLSSAGSSQIIKYFIGNSRIYSVFISTNNYSSLVGDIGECIKNAGCDVKISKELNSAVNGLTIHYVPHAEGFAREISQRIMLKFGLTANLVEMKMIDSHDVVIWVGNGVSPKKTSL